MTREERVKRAIQAVVRRMMDRVMDKVLHEDPFLAEEHRSKKPLYAALVPDEIFKGAHFERRFVTPFGSAWEALAEAVGKETRGVAIRGHTVAGAIPRERLRRIQEILNRLEHRQSDQNHKPAWPAELAYILEGGGEPVPTQVVCDIFVNDVNTREKLAFELKAPLPNSDQTKVSKEKIFKLYAMKPSQISAAYYALPYNPYGSRARYAWSFPKRWFDMQRDEVVLIGDDFWDRIGGPGTYQSFVEAVNEMGAAYKDRIYREFLGVEPPHDPQGKL